MIERAVTYILAVTLAAVMAAGVRYHVNAMNAAILARWQETAGRVIGR